MCELDRIEKITYVKYIGIYIEIRERIYIEIRVFR